MSVLCRSLAKDAGHESNAAALAGILHALGAIVLVDAVSHTKRNAIPGDAMIMLIRALHGWAAARAAVSYRVDPIIVSALEAHHHDPGATPLGALVLLTDALAPSEPGRRCVPVDHALAAAGLDLDAEAVGRVVAPLLAHADIRWGDAAG